MAETTNLLELIAGQTSRTIGTVRAAGLAAANNAVGMEDAAKDSEKIYKNIAQDQALVIRTQQLASMQVQQATQKAVTAAGGMDALYDTIGTLRTSQQQLRGELDVLRTEEVNATGLNILGRVKKALDWDGTRAKVAATAGKIEKDVAVASAIEGRINAVGTIARNSAESITTASIDASARIAAAGMSLRANQARIEGLRANSDQLNQIANMEDKTLDAMIKLQGVARGEDQYQLALREEQRRKEQFSWQKEQADAIKAEKISARDFDARTKYYVNLAEAARGQPLSDGPEWEDQLKLFKSGASKAIEDLYLKGKMIHRDGVSYIGTSPADTARILSADSRGLNLPEERKKALALVTEAQAALAQARKLPASPLQDDKDGSKAAGFINGYVNDRVTRDLGFIGNNLDNPFHIGDLGSYIGTAANPGVLRFQSYPLVQRVLNPALAANQSLSDPNVVVGLAMAAVRKGDISSYQAAADITNIYRRANLLHRAAVGFDTLGIRTPTGGAGYRVKINGKVVDMTDWPAVARAMNEQGSADALKAYQSQSFGLREPIKQAVRNIPLSGGSNITYTPDAQAEGTRRARDDVAGRNR